MTISHEIKSQLAKLLATEDLMVEHRQVETAQFNVHTRVLTLPVWEKASADVYDMLVAHEVGHALYTPNRDWFKEVNISPQFVNIVEDVRIEKMMKRRYGGISKTFYRGYNELSNEDFFCLENEDISKMNLADRVNLHFKIGSFVDIPFDEYLEMPIVRMVDGCEDFDDVLLAAEALYKFCKQEMQNNENPQQDNEVEQSGSSSDSSPQVPNPTTEGDQSENEDQEEPGETDSYGGTAEAEDDFGGETVGNDEPEAKTADTLDQALKDLARYDGEENVYLEVPKLNLDKVIIANSDIHEKCSDAWTASIERSGEDNSIFDIVDNEFIKFKRSAQKEVNYLIKEFECKKAADSYARATTARSGVLDCSKLHTYKYNEDLFKKVTTLADGKNHGLVFVLDWSGSMQDVMMDTIKQLYNLIWFCKKVSIPFDVYAFTSDYPRFDPREGRDWQYERKHGTLHVPDYFSMMNLFTSKTNGKSLEIQMKNIFRVAYSFRHYCGYLTPYGLGLSGTPLNESLISLHQILPKFKQDHKLQKVQCVILTDGDGCMTKYDRELQRRWEDEPFIGTATIRHNAFLRNRKTGNTYSLDCPWYDFTDILLRDLKETFKDINFIGMRIMAGRDAGSFIRRYCGYYGDEFERNMNSWKKLKTCTITTSGYHKYFGLSSQHISQETDFDVKEDATKAQIKSAFKKSLSNKKMNKKVLSEFVELIA